MSLLQYAHTICMGVLQQWHQFVSVFFLLSREHLQQSVINLGDQVWPPDLSRLQSSFIPFPVVDSPWDLDRARSPAVKHFDAVTVKQPYKCTMLTNILGERGDHGGRAEVPGEIIDYRPCMMYSSMAVLIWTPITNNEGARTPTGSPPLPFSSYWFNSVVFYSPYSEDLNWH